MTNTACAPTGTELYEKAKQVNLRMKAEVAALQLRIFDGEWETERYGDIADTCGASGFSFYFTRSTPSVDGWRLPQGSAAAAAEDLMAWLAENGWSRIRHWSYSEGISQLSVEAEKPSAHIDDLLITISPGKVMDWVRLKVQGTCEPGDGDELYELMYPDGLEEREERPLEHPTAEPKFGLATPNPTPRP